MARVPALLALVGAVTWTGAAHAAPGCPAAHIEWPARGATLVEARPEIAWQALPGVARYRVQVESRTPEGALLARADTLVSGHRFVPPFPLAESRATVRASVAAVCEAADKSHAGAPAQFFIDLAGRCAPPSAVELEGATLRWAPVQGAQGYELLGYAAFGGISLVHQVTRDTTFRLPRTESPAYVMLRARCGAAYSAPVYQVFANPSAR